MIQKMTLLPGTTNDNNRDYLPEAIQGSDMVVNENGNNSQVYPARLQTFTDVLVGDEPDTWCEYVPTSYDARHKVPLVISMHGGLMTGWGQAIYTSWTMVADREGFIVLFPNAHQSRFWVLETSQAVRDGFKSMQSEDLSMHDDPKDPRDNHDMNMVLALLERMKAKYSIDEGRVFMQGMSMGNLMTSQFARHYGHLLAGKAGSAGPAYTSVLFDENDQPINHAGPLAVWQTRVELDEVPPFFGGTTDEIVKRNREYWRRINQCDALPQIKIIGEDNFAFYHGKHADQVFRDVKNRDHGQTLDDAEIVWDYLFSGVRRDQSGKIVHTDTRRARTGDAFAIALAAGKDKAYLNNRLVQLSGHAFMHQKLKYHGLQGKSKVRGTYMMAPISFVAQAFGASITLQQDGRAGQITLPDGKTLAFAQGSIGCVIDQELYSMFCEAILCNGELYLPIQWIAQRVLNYQSSQCDGVVYITDHYAELSLNMAHLIRDEVLC